MPLFVNNKQTPGVYKSSVNERDLSNQQKVFRLSYLNEILNDQQVLNKKLSNSVESFQASLKDNHYNQNQHFSRLLSKLGTQEDYSTKVLDNMKVQELTSVTLINKLTDLESNNKTLLTNFEQGELANTAILNQLNIQENFIRDIFRKLQDHEHVSASLLDQLKKQEEMNEQISRQLSLQDVYHQTIMERFDQHDAEGEKISRQLDSLRSILYERASYITAVIEENFKNITNYVVHLLKKPLPSKENEKSPTEKEQETINK
ncbi:hypothetical protein [Mesobacillus harenae]|uniref:hypothetical protein n=1 Tax=Mesobacillus harenae TaxID=2213203 RepID=UPI001580502C|nr:hypothetical protein [Mesobacillus harenae]